MRSLKKISEEIARWTFEVKCKSDKFVSSNWYVAFTNPTAGPWKTIKCTNSKNEEGEVYRFADKEKRPDTILVNDTLRVVIIIEAKKDFKSLIDEKSGIVEKSVDVVADMTNMLSNKSSNEYWGSRSEYTIITSILWGSDKGETLMDINRALMLYSGELKRRPHLNSLVIGIETKKTDCGHLVCSMFADKVLKSMSSQLETIASSLDIPLNYC